MYEIYCKLRDLRGLKDSDVARETGITKSTFTDWRNGRSSPKDEKLRKIATLFGCSVEYLKTGVDSNSINGYYLNDETAAIAQDIFDNKELRALFSVQKDMSPEDLRALHNMALALKRKEMNFEE